MEKPINSASFTPFPKTALKAPMTAVADVVRWCLTTLCGAAFYTVHRCSGKSDAFTIRPVPMVTEMDVVSCKMLLLVLPETAVKSTPSACVHSQNKHNLGSLRDGDPVTVQCSCLVPLSIALWWQLSDSFIMLLNCGAVSLWLLDQRDRQTSHNAKGRGCTAAPLQPPLSPCDVLMVSAPMGSPRQQSGLIQTWCSLMNYEFLI